MEVHTITLPSGVRLECAEAGPLVAEAVLLLHGNGPNWRQFEPQLRSLTDRWRVLAPSLRGHGNSSMPPVASPEEFTVARLSGDIRALLDHLDVARVHLVGNSLGGLVGLEIARTEPDRLASLVTFGTTAQLSASPGLVRTMTGLLRVLGTTGTGWLTGWSVKNVALGRRIGRLIGQADPVAVRYLTANIATYDYTEVLRTSQVPYLLLRGEMDRSINRALGTTLEAIADRDDAHVVDLAGAGHFANLEQPKAFDHTLRTFLDQHAGQR